MASIDSLDLNLLLVFDALLRTHSVTLAAERLNMGQSSMSGALKRLRAALNDPLFVKTGAGMTPTAFAQGLAGPIQTGLSQIRAALDNHDQFDPSQSDRRFVLYASDTGQLVFLPKLLAAIRLEAPGVRIHTLQCEMRQARQMMSVGDIDLALGYFVEFDDSLHRGKLFLNEYVCIASAQHPSIRDSITLEQFGEAPHLVYRPTVGSHRTIDQHIVEMCTKRGIQRKEAMEVSHGIGIADIVAHTDLVACVPRLLGEYCARNGEVQVLNLPVEIPSVEISMYWHERAHKDAGLLWVRRLVRSIFSNTQ